MILTTQGAMMVTEEPGERPTALEAQYVFDMLDRHRADVHDLQIAGGDDAVSQLTSFFSYLSMKLFRTKHFIKITWNQVGHFWEYTIGTPCFSDNSFS